jgi:hypothetical protein
LRQPIERLGKQVGQFPSNLLQHTVLGLIDSLDTHSQISGYGSATLPVDCDSPKRLPSVILNSPSDEPQHTVHEGHFILRPLIRVVVIWLPVWDLRKPLLSVRTASGFRMALTPAKMVVHLALRDRPQPGAKIASGPVEAKVPYVGGDREKDFLDHVGHVIGRHARPPAPSV